MDNENYYYNKKLQSNANALRKNMTKAEACIWKYVLRAKQLKGLQFRRQRAIGKYIADFACLEKWLIIEIDGGTHNIDSVAQYDKVREADLIELGFRVVRFTDKDVLENIDGVRQYLEVLVEDFPPPAPASGG